MSGEDSAEELVCFDMAGTTVRDNGLVQSAFERTLDDMGVADGDRAAMVAYVVDTMGQSKIDVFSHLFGESAAVANDRFESAFALAASSVGVTEVPGARAVVDRLRERGLKVALTTGFSPATRDLLLDRLGWRDLFDVVVSPADAGRGRPAPDMLLVCVLRAAISAVGALVVVGDTSADMEAGRRAGAGRCVGVLTGTDSEARLRAGGADAVITSVADLDHVLGA